MALGAPICVASYPRPDGSESSVAVVGMRKDCNVPAAVSPLELAVDKAYEQAQRLTVSIQPEGLNAGYEKGLSPDERTRRAREAYLTSEDFLRAVVPRLRIAMTAEGLACVGCPEFVPRPIRKVTWTEFAPYLAAYVWPDPVRTPRDANGERHYSFHVCTGLNGIGELKDPDPTLVRAGFVVAFNNRELRQIAGEHFQDTLNEPAFVSLKDDDTRTRYLRSHMPVATANDPAARAAACHVLESFTAELGVEISDCGESHAAKAR